MSYYGDFYLYVVYLVDDSPRSREIQQRLQLRVDGMVEWIIIAPSIQVVYNIYKYIHRRVMVSKE